MEPLIKEHINNLQSLFKEFQSIIAVYLFGSRVDGTFHTHSDYDIGVLLNSYINNETAGLMQMELEEKAESILNCPVDIVLLNYASIVMRFKVINNGTVLYCRDEEKRTDFEEIVMRDYHDFKPFLDAFNRDVAEAISKGEFFVK